MFKTRRRRRRKNGAAKFLGAIVACAVVCAAVFGIAGFFTEAVRGKLNPSVSAAPLITSGVNAENREESPNSRAEIVNANPLSPVAPQDLPKVFHAGTGEALALPLSGLIIGIDPGHQSSGNSEQEPVAPGSDETKAKVSSGTQGTATGTPEYEVNLIIALKLRDALAGLGADVAMTRATNDVNISNVERAQMMNEAGADLVLRLHCNGSTNASVNGIGLYVNATGEIAEPSYAAAESILPAMTDRTGAHAAGIFRRDTYTGLNWSEVPCILVEMGYMSNYEESLSLEDDAYQEKLVSGMVDGIAAYFSRTVE